MRATHARMHGEREHERRILRCSSIVSFFSIIFIFSSLVFSSSEVHYVCLCVCNTRYLHTHMHCVTMNIEIVLIFSHDFVFDSSRSSFSVLRLHLACVYTTLSKFEEFTFSFRLYNDIEWDCDATQGMTFFECIMIEP